MKRYCLIGKNIAHSLSPDIYKGLIPERIEYTLFDCSDETKIPNASILLNSFDGVNITSPYKKYFFNKAVNSEVVTKLNSLNCLKIKDGKFYSENTDYFAIVKIIKERFDIFKDCEVYILGDGVMSHLTQVVLNELEVPFVILSRSKNLNFSFLNFNQLNTTGKKTVVINTCSRDYVFKGELPSSSLFWDYNYNFRPHASSDLLTNIKYIDGAEMLKIQAQFAIAFWSDNSKFLKA